MKMLKPQKTTPPRDNDCLPISTDEAVEAKSPQIRHLIERIGMMNRIHTALRFTLNVDDIYQIILTAVVSRFGLDFSRAFLIGYDENRGNFHGQDALGAVSREQHESLRREMEEEEKCLAKMVDDFSRMKKTSRAEETIFNRSLRELSQHSLWITTYQKLDGENNELQQAIQQVEFPLPAASQAPGRQFPFGFLKNVLAGETTRLVTPQEIKDSDLFPSLANLLLTNSLWSPIRTQKGLRLILIVDKMFHPEPLTDDDMVHLDWFVGQVALALENAEMFRDLEETYQSLRELDKMKSNFLATISHELRTPLTAIHGYVQLMLSNRIGELSQGQRDVLERIHAHSDLLTGKVNDLIEIAELDSGRGDEMKLEPVDPLDVLTSVLPKVEPRRAQKRISIEPIVTGPIPKIRANKGALERIFFHLIDNAIKFGQTCGHVRIEFSAADGEARITVSDDGIGISENQLKKIFESFYQIDSQLARNYEGMGLGLAVIKKQLDFTGGRILVESRPTPGIDVYGDLSVGRVKV